MSLHLHAIQIDYGTFRNNLSAQTCKEGSIVDGKNTFVLQHSLLVLIRIDNAE